MEVAAAVDGEVVEVPGAADGDLVRQILGMWQGVARIHGHQEAALERVLRLILGHSLVLILGVLLAVAAAVVEEEEVVEGCPDNGRRCWGWCLNQAMFRPGNKAPPAVLAVAGEEEEVVDGAVAEVADGEAAEEEEEEVDLVNSEDSLE